MRVGNDERGSAGHGEGGELFGRELGALYMHMPVDEPRRYYFSAEVIFDFAFVLAHSRYLPAADCNVAAAHAYRKHVEVGGVLQHDVGLPPSSRNVCKAHGKKRMSKTERTAEIARLTRQMKEAAKLLEFELAAELRDQIKALESEK